VHDSRARLRTLSAQIDHLFDVGKREEAAALLQAALADSAADRPYHLFFQSEAAGYLERNRKKQRECLMEACTVDPDDPFIVKCVGVYHLVNGSERKAIRLFDRAIDLDPSDHEPFRHKGLAYSNLGRETRAMEWFAKAVAVNPADYDALRQTGVSLSKLGKDREAIDWYRKSLTVNEEDYDSMRQLGISLAMVGNYDAAVKWLNLALAVNPNDFESKRNLRLVRKKMTGEGETVFSRLLTFLGRKLATFWRRVLDR
jgi:tetratricopeptide (TPR) repeat protein